jgi:hypothetical protein
MLPIGIKRFYDTRLKSSVLIKTVALFFSVAFLAGPFARAQNAPTEYQIKAAFIYHFAEFVNWPTGAFTDASSPMVIGILGNNDFDGNLQRTINGKTVRGHPLQVRQLASPAEATNCQVLFISKSEKGNLSKILAPLQGNNILTVSETDNFIDAGGMINLVIVEDKVRFQINNDAAKKAGLTISSKLLSLAVNNR